jgi:heme a synthase
MFRYFKQYTVVVFILVFLVILAGGIVRTTQSGMGCPDWPKCFGSWIPPTRASQLPPDFEKYLRQQDIDHHFNAFHTWVEYINRLLGALLGLMAVLQTAWAYRYKKQNPKVFYAALAVLAIVVLTGLFGAMVVKLHLAHLSISVHLLLAIVLAQIQLLVLLRCYRWPVINIGKRNQYVIIAFLMAVFIQSIMGTWVRIYVDDISKQLNYSQRSTWLQSMPSVLIAHRSFSWLVVLFVGYLLKKFYRTAIKSRILFLCSLVVGNILVGIILLYAHLPAMAQPIHLLLAAAIVTQCFYLLFTTTHPSRSVNK